MNHPLRVLFPAFLGGVTAISPPTAADGATAAPTAARRGTDTKALASQTKPQSGPDLVARFSGSPIHYSGSGGKQRPLGCSAGGRLFAVEITLENRGDREARIDDDSVQLSSISHPGWKANVQRLYQSRHALKPGETTPLLLSMYGFSDPEVMKRASRHEFKLVTDPLEKVVERNEANNSTPVTVEMPAACQPVKVERYRGQGKGELAVQALDKEVNFVRYPGRAPVLSGFSFAHSEADHRVETLGVLHTVPDAPKGRSTLTMSLIDDSGTGSEPPYFWTADLVDVAAEGAQGTIQRKEGSCTGSCERALSIRPNEVFLLSGFSFKFRGDDHDIKTIAIAERGGTLSVEFKDKNGDDPFDWSVQYVLVNKARAASVAGRGGTVNSGGVAQSTIDAVPHAKPVLSGFRVEYLEGDHQVREFGVGVTDGRLAVKLADKNGDDRFKWSVNWVSLLR